MGTEALLGTVRKEESERVDLFTVELDELLKIVNDPSFIKPMNYYFLIALPRIEEKTRGGIILPGESMDSSLIGNNIGRIVGKGSTIGGTSGVYADCKSLNVGDYIGYNPHGTGTPFEYDGWRLIPVTDQNVRVHIPDVSKRSDGIAKTFKTHGVN